MTVCKPLRSFHLLGGRLVSGRRNLSLSVVSALVLAFFQSLDANRKILSAIDKEVG